MHKGWFVIPGLQDGDRTIEQQLLGLDALIAEAPGKAMVFLGCAEGLIERTMAERGARRVHGVDSNPQFVRVGREMLKACGGTIEQHDLNLPWQPPFAPDIVCALAVLHKLRAPLELVDRIKDWQPRLVVVRLPARTPGYVLDARSGNVKFDVVARLRPQYDLERVARGWEDEWTGYFRRIL